MNERLIAIGNREKEMNELQKMADEIRKYLDALHRETDNQLNEISSGFHREEMKGFQRGVSFISANLDIIMRKYEKN